MKNQKFYADGYVSRDKYPSAVALENYLNELNNPHITKWTKKVLGGFCRHIKDLKDSKLKSKQLHGSFLVDSFTKTLDAAVSKPEKCRSLLRNVIITKYRIEILESDKSEKGYGALGILSKDEARLEKIIDNIHTNVPDALKNKVGNSYGELGVLTIDESKIDEITDQIKNTRTLESIGILKSYMIKKY